MPRQVADIEVEEIHLVDSPANKRKFLLLKSHGSQTDAATDVLDETEEEKAAREKAEAEAKAKEEAEAAVAEAEAKAVAEKAAAEKVAADKLEADALKGPEAGELSPELTAALATVSPEAKAELTEALSKAHLSPEAEKARRIVMADLLMQMRSRIDDIFEMLSKSQKAEAEAVQASTDAEKAKTLEAEALAKSQDEEVNEDLVKQLTALAESMPDADAMKELTRTVKAHSYV